MLVQDGKSIPQGRISYGTAKEICEARGIPTTFEEDTVIEGWLDKPMGQKQVLWERGLIDCNKLTRKMDRKTKKATATRHIRWRSCPNGELP